MTPCPEQRRLQDFLDGELTAASAVDFRTHLEGCRECASELAAYGRLFRALETVPLAEPAPGLTERILFRVSPARARRRLLRTVGWSYAGTLAACFAALLVWMIQPTAATTLAGLLGEASRRLLGTAVFVLDAYAFAILRVADGWNLLATWGGRLAPVQRALGTLLAHSGFEQSLALAAMSCAALLWWMRLREKRDGEEVRHVGVLGF